MFGVKLGESLFNVSYDFVSVVERSMRELGVAFVEFFASVVHQTEGHVDVGFDQLDANAIGSSMVVSVCHRSQVLGGAEDTLSHLQ